tara:strand:+ start:735 stop:1259 length:525 start_codon:yes stop_codon:yes gene_type:complete
MECQKAAAQLSAYFDDELASDIADRVSQHLESCQTCQAKLQSFESIRKLSTQYCEPATEAPSWETFAARMNTAQPTVQFAPDQSPCGRRRLKDVVIIIAALAASVVILLSIRQPERSDEHAVAQQHSHSHAGALAGMPSAPIDFQNVVLDFNRDSSLAVGVVRFQIRRNRSVDR